MEPWGEVIQLYICQTTAPLVMCDKDLLTILLFSIAQIIQYYPMKDTIYQIIRWIHLENELDHLKTKLRIEISKHQINLIKAYTSLVYNFKAIQTFWEAGEPTLANTLERLSPTVVCATGHNEVGQAWSALWNISDWGGSVSRKPPHYCRTADRSVPVRFTQSCLSERVEPFKSQPTRQEILAQPNKYNDVTLNCDCGR